VSRLVAGLAALALGGCGSSCNQQPLPSSDVCELAPGAPRATVALVEIGRLENDQFVPIVADSVAPLTTGGQGIDMIVAALRVTGTGLTTCIAQETVLETVDGMNYSSESAPILARMVAPSVMVTGSILLPFYGPSGQPARLRATVAGTTAEVVFWVDYHGELEVDAAAPDARIDAAPHDAIRDAEDDATVDAAPDA